MKTNAASTTDMTKLEKRLTHSN